jgi:hypothetical protein
MRDYWFLYYPIADNKAEFDMSENYFYCRPEGDIASLTSFISCNVTHKDFCPPKLVKLPRGIVIHEGSKFDFEGETFLIIWFNDKDNKAYRKVM